jgi:MFS family permease
MSDCISSLQNSQPIVNTKIQTTVFVILSVSLLFIGIGQTALTTLGIPYIDDNVKAAQSSLYIAITIGVRILGPLLGYYLGSYCLTRYVDLSKDVDTKDVNFIGAWWLGKMHFLLFSLQFIMIIFKKGKECNSRQMKKKNLICL